MASCACSPAWRRRQRQLRCWAAAAHVALLLLCLAAASSPDAPIYEDVLYQAKQEAAAPPGRPDFQARALAAFATGLDADPFGVLPLWAGDSHPCGDGSNNNHAWPGIECDAPGGFVTAIRLRGKGLAGRLPSGLSVLGHLRTLDLSSNAFNGSLPPVWSNLSSLEAVDLSSNYLTGTLPASFGSWSAMQSMDLHGNAFSGPLPAAWSGMTLLEVLDLSSNTLSGSLPAAWSQLAHLSVLDMHNNSLEGSLPAAWSEQRSLLQLSIGDNRIKGVLPPQWAGGMDSLRGVNATGNSLHGQLPGEWSNMTSLQTLSVGKNQLTGSIPSTWGRLRSLFIVNVTQNSGLCGPVPDGVSGKLEGGDTQLPTCRWSGDAEHLLAFKAGLADPQRQLAGWLPGSNPCGASPWQGLVCERGSVVAVRLQGKGLSGPLAPQLARLSRVQELRLPDNELTGPLPESWGADAPPSLAVIDLARNGLSGPLPASWSRLSSLKHLDLSANLLSGSLPEEWSALGNLTTLLLSDNRRLNGTLPGAWAQLAALQSVRLDSGNFTGSLPASWSHLSMIREVSLSSNALTGGVPVPWPQQLRTLDLSGNQRMCGVLDVPPGADVRAQLTGLGAACGAPPGQLSGSVAVAFGVCLGVAGAVMLAGAAFLVTRVRARALSRTAVLAARSRHEVARSSSPSSASLPSQLRPNTPNSPRAGSWDAGRLVVAGTPVHLLAPSPPASPVGAASAPRLPGMMSPRAAAAASGAAVGPSPMRAGSSPQLAPGPLQQHRLAVGSAPPPAPLEHCGSRPGSACGGAGPLEAAWFALEGDLDGAAEPAAHTSDGSLGGSRCGSPLGLGLCRDGASPARSPSKPGGGTLIVSVLGDAGGSGSAGSYSRSNSASSPGSLGGLLPGPAINARAAELLALHAHSLTAGGSSHTSASSSPRAARPGSAGGAGGGGGGGGGGGLKLHVAGTLRASGAPMLGCGLGDECPFTPPPVADASPAASPRGGAVLAAPVPEAPSAPTTMMLHGGGATSEGPAQEA